ncbi:MAG TPA: carboxypeptidase regulatory-like domain-containing protein [Longimicrobiales bacterium]|nr:carboxypeptidase regulatory-like domain-containing protein [Longimicrobiales bacterium]
MAALLLCAAANFGSAAEARAQGVTTAALTGTVTDGEGNPVVAATIAAVHTPSGTTYQGWTRADGRYAIPGMRVGGPYRVTASSLGYEPQVTESVFLNLGVTAEANFVLRVSAIELSTIVVTTNAVFSPDRTGAATAVSRDALSSLPTVTRRIEDFVRLTPQYSGGPFGFSFAGQDNRLNNMTVDGSYFNNSFGLAGQPGDRTGVSPISLDAIEQVQVNIAPYDVRQGNFVGAGVNMVTRSGTNNFRGSLRYDLRNEGLVGTQAGDNEFDPGTFSYRQIGGWLSGPIIRDKLFFFANFENDGLTEPGTTFLANTGGQTVEGNVTRVLSSDLDALSNYLQTNFGYDTGPYQGYNHETPATRFLGKLDYNVNARNKLSLRYNHLDSRTDVLASNSSSLGFGSRRTNSNALNFQNSNYIILENIRSLVGEWNATIGANMANNLIAGFTYHDESRDSRGDFFPLVDILGGDSRTYTTVGFEPFTPSNELRYGSFQLQDNFTIYGVAHSLTFGASMERYESENVFFPGSQSVYTYNTLDDFYADANDFLAQCGTDSANWASCSRATSPVPVRRFQVRWSNIPGQEKPIQPLEVFFAGVYAQDEWQVNQRLRLTGGLRLDVPVFGDTGFENAEVDAMTFRDPAGDAVSFSTSNLPDANVLFSPRFGFNLDVTGDRSTQLRGGTGIFTGRPAYVWISNQIGENGVLTGFEQLNDTNLRPFHPDPNHYKPATVTGDPAASYGLAFTAPDFRFPQLWRTNVAADQRLPFDLSGTLEFLYSKDVNGVSYYNANLTEPNTAFVGVDDRPRWTADNCPTISGVQARVNCNVTGAFVLDNQNDGHAWNLAASVERPLMRGLYAKALYSYGVAKNTVDPGSIAFGSWNNNQHSGDPNNPGTGYSSNSPGHRALGAVSYRADLLGFGATTVGLIAEAYTQGNASYVFSGDLNGDGGSSNDLIYIPADLSEMNFVECDPTIDPNASCGAYTFSAAEQAAAWDAFIEQDPYLREHRGEYAQRGAAFLPMVFRADLSLAQELFTDIRGTRNALEVRLDIKNFTNLLSSGWGVGDRFVTTRPLIAAGADSQGRVRYRLATSGSDLISESFEPNAGFSDVYRIQIGLRYTFN